MSSDQCDDDLRLPTRLLHSSESACAMRWMLSCVLRSRLRHNFIESPDSDIALFASKAPGIKKQFR